MTPCEKRYGLLVGLAWELQRLGVGSYVVIPARGEALLQICCADGFRLSVLVAQWDGHWLFIWSPSGHIAADHIDLAAREIAAAVHHRVA
jgi:hypothetical protein